MKVAIIGSREITVNNLKDYVPETAIEIVSGGASGIDFCAKEYAIKNNLKLTEFLPEYNKYGKNAPLKRNLQIIEYADYVIAIWDGKSRGTKFVIDNCQQQGKPLKVYIKTTQNKKGRV